MPHRWTRWGIAERIERAYLASTLDVDPGFFATISRMVAAVSPVKVCPDGVVTVYVSRELFVQLQGMTTSPPSAPRSTPTWRVPPPLNPSSGYGSPPCPL